MKRARSVVDWANPELVAARIRWELRAYACKAAPQRPAAIPQHRPGALGAWLEWLAAPCPAAGPVAPQRFEVRLDGPAAAGPAAAGPVAPQRFEVRLDGPAAAGPAAAGPVAPQRFEVRLDYPEPYRRKRAPRRKTQA